MPRARNFAFIALAVWLGGGLAAWAQSIERINTFRDWGAWRYGSGGDTVCYMASEPKQATGDYTNRGDVFAIVTHRPGDKRIGEVSIVAGYTFKEGSTAELKIGSKSWDLFTSGDNAWAPSADDDRAIVKAMRAGSSMVVSGTSSRGTATTDTYSLLGVSKAYAAISSACGV